MARVPRIDVGNEVYHVINRSNGRVSIFNTAEEYRDFEYLLFEISETYAMRILAYVIMPNHWHLLLHPREDGDIGRAMQWLGTSHVRRHHTRKRTIGQGHLYQGRFKSFIVQSDDHLLTVLKYIERNPVRAKLSKTAETWQWGSARRRMHGTEKEKKLLAESPVPLPRNYKAWINDPEPAEEAARIRKSVETAIPYGEEQWRNSFSSEKAILHHEI